MEKLLHERLREHYGECTDFECAGRLLALRRYAAIALADEIERYYIPRKEHEHEIDEVIEAQGRHFPAAHHIMQAWAKSHDMEWPDGASITKFLDHYYIPRPRFEDGGPMDIDTETNLGTIELLIWNGKGWILENYFCDQYSCENAKRPSPKVLDADGVEIKVGDTVWHSKSGNEYKVIELGPEGHGRVRLRDLSGYETWRSVANLTHKEPDSLEKLRDDISEYVAMFDIVGSTQERYHQIWADRLTAIMERDA